MAGKVYRKEHWFITIAVTGIALDTQSWDKATGGDINPTMVKYPLGGMGGSVAIGGRRERNDITIERAWDDTLITLWKKLDDASGDTPATVSLQPLVRRGNAAGKPINYSGILAQVTRPDADSSSSDAATMTVVVSLNETVSGGGT